MDELARAIRALEAKLVEVNAWLAGKRREDGVGNLGHASAPEPSVQDEAGDLRELIRNARAEAGRRKRM